MANSRNRSDGAAHGKTLTVEATQSGPHSPSPWDIRVPAFNKNLHQFEEPTVLIPSAGSASGTYRTIDNDNNKLPVGRMLAVAAGSGRRDLVDLFLSAGADPNLRLDNGWTPLMCAAVGGHVEIVSDLLQAGADPDIETAERTALDLAVEAQTIPVVEFLRQKRAREQRWSEQRGVCSFELQQSFLLIRARVEDAVRALGQTCGWKRHEIRVHGRRITASEECCLALQFAGHEWTIIVPVCTSPGDRSFLSSHIARAISIAICDRTVLYTNREDRLGYELFERGSSAESLSYGALDPIQASRPVSFRSLRRNVSPALLGFPERLVDTFIRDLGTLIPGIAYHSTPGMSLHVLPELRKDDFARIDYLVIL